MARYGADALRLWATRGRIGTDLRYNEMIKDRTGEASARWTLWESYRVLLGLFAPFAPFVTEHMYQRFYRQHEDLCNSRSESPPALCNRWLKRAPERR